MCVVLKKKSIIDLFGSTAFSVVQNDMRNNVKVKKKSVSNGLHFVVVHLYLKL